MRGWSPCCGACSWPVLAKCSMIWSRTKDSWTLAGMEVRLTIGGNWPGYGDLLSCDLGWLHLFSSQRAAFQNRWTFGKTCSVVLPGQLPSLTAHEGGCLQVLVNCYVWGNQRCLHFLCTGKIVLIISISSYIVPSLIPWTQLSLRGFIPGCMTLRIFFLEKRTLPFPNVIVFSRRIDWYTTWRILVTNNHCLSSNVDLDLSISPFIYLQSLDERNTMTSELSRYLFRS